MPVYSAYATCVKCGHGTAATNFMPARHPKPERIVRTCGRCGYSWDEIPLDQTAKEVTPFPQSSPST